MTAVDHYGGLDVSLELTSVCIVDAQGRIVRETKVRSDPEDLVRYFSCLKLAVTRIALEAGPLSQWLHARLIGAGLEIRKGPKIGAEAELWEKIRRSVRLSSVRA